jgi:hypothetical protein
MTPTAQSSEPHPARPNNGEIAVSGGRPRHNQQVTITLPNGATMIGRYVHHERAFHEASSAGAPSGHDVIVPACFVVKK